MAQYVRFEKIVPEGKALGYWNDQACFCVGPLPGELVWVSINKLRKGYSEAVWREVKEPSEHRGEPAEVHHMVCSPWQGVDYAYQLKLKRQMLAECVSRPGLELPVLAMIEAPRTLGYRNKLEFSLQTDEAGRMKLAFHERGSMQRLVELPEGCALGSAEMNAAALGLLETINGLDLAGVAEGIIVRQSQSTKKIIGVLVLRDRAKRDWAGLRLPELAGVVVCQIMPGRQLKELWRDGETELTETLGGVELQYPYDGFFQVNVPMFERALAQILAAIPAGAEVVDLYGGPGTIGLPAAKVASRVAGVEIQTSAVAQANTNARRSGVSNYRAEAVPAEKMNAGVLDGADVVILDPPRAGLHKKVVQMLLEAAPKRIIYLSCNPVTQARDLMLLAGEYETEGVIGFDFYPGTLHLESLAVLDRKA